MTFLLRGAIASLFILALPAGAHTFGPASMHNAMGPKGVTHITMQLTSKWSGLYSFSVGGKTLHDANGQPARKYVMAGMRADFPMVIANKYVRDNHILICSWENRDSVMFRQEVCFNVKVA